jgi:hypothetical protein
MSIAGVSSRSKLQSPDGAGKGLVALQESIVVVCNGVEQGEGNELNPA